MESKELVKEEEVNEFGLSLKQENELTLGLSVVRKERDLLIQEFEVVSKLEITKENIPKFKALRLKFMKNRTGGKKAGAGVLGWHAVNKEPILLAGKYIDSKKVQECQINESHEAVLMASEKTYENLEKERLEDLQKSRATILSEYVEDANMMDLSGMTEDVFNSVLVGKKKIKEDKDAEAEKERLARNEAVRLQKLDDERRGFIGSLFDFLPEDVRSKTGKLGEYSEKEFYEILSTARKAKQVAEDKVKATEKENLRLKKIVDDAATKAKELKEANEAKELTAQTERERLAKIESDKNDAIIEKERAATQKIIDAEKAKTARLVAEAEKVKKATQTKKENEAKAIQLELSKGDEDKVKDLISDLKALKTKYKFESTENKAMYSDVGLLMDKVILHVKN